MSEVTLVERRAEFVYNAARLAAIAAQAPIVPVPWAEREEAFKKQFLEVIERQCGPTRSMSPEELHGSWVQAYIAMGWRYGSAYSREDKTHPDMVPYAKLGQLERDKDAVFVALCEIARQWVYDLSDGHIKPKPIERWLVVNVDGETIYRAGSKEEAKHAIETTFDGNGRIVHLIEAED